MGEGNDDHHHHHHFISDINVSKNIESNSTSSNNSTIWYDKLNNTISKTMVGKYFNLESRKTNFTTELRAATSTFLTMVYIITVNASILSESGGPCSSSDCSSSNDPSCVIKQNPGYDLCVERVKSDLIVATSITAMIGSISMGVIANLPFGLAPGMGPNVYFAYNLVGFHGMGGVMSYETGMGVVFVEGLIFMVISVIGLRLRLARLIPKAVRLGCGAGLGLFICFTGLQTNLGLGIVGPDKSTLVTLTGCRVTDPDSGVCIEGKMENPRLWLGMIGFVIICYSSMMKNSFVKGSMILGIMFVTFISWVRDSKVTFFPYNSIGDARYEYFTKVVDFHLIKSTAGAISFEDFNRGEVWVALMTLLYVDVVATTGTLYTMAELGGFITTTNGNDDGGGGGGSSTEGFEGEYAAYIVDAGSTVIGSLLGVTPTATYVESTAGIKEGGRSGLTAVIIGFYFMLSLFFTPLMVSVPPWAIGPALVMIGVMMMKVVKDIEWGEVKEAVPAFITMVIMPLTYSISNGIIGGIGFYVVLSGYDYGVRLIKMRRKMVREENQVSATGGMDSVNVV